MNKLVIGTIAGLAATAPMTLAMKAMHRNLPPQDRHPLPPREVTMNIAEKVGLKEHLNEPLRRELTIVSHFAYGAAAGAVYASLEEKMPLPPPFSGVCFGHAVWVGSYLGWLPMAGIQPPVTEKSSRRVALMIAAHVVWGAATDLALNSLKDKEDS